MGLLILFNKKSALLLGEWIMTEKEKFWEEVDKRETEFLKMSSEEYDRIEIMVSAKYWKLYPNSFIGCGREMSYGPVARMEVAMKMGKPVDEITGIKYNPNIIY